MTMNITRDQISLMIYYDYKKKDLERAHFEDEPRADRPRNSFTTENIEAVH